MKNFWLSSAIALLYACFVSASGVSRCYSCSSAACNDPFNSANADIMNCSNMSNYRSLSTNTDSEWGTETDVLFQKFNTLYDANTEFVCIKYFANSTVVNSNFTMRRCIAKYVNNIGACDFATQTAGAGGFVVKSCSTCDSDLCNSATRWSSATILTAVFVLFGFLLRQNT